MIKRKEIKPTKKKQVSFLKPDEQENEDQEKQAIIFTLKRKQGEVPYDNIVLENDEELLQLFNKKKVKKYDLDDLISQTEQLTIKEEDSKIMVLQRMEFKNIGQCQLNNDIGTISILQDKREQFAKTIRKNAINNILNTKRNQMIIQLKQENDKLTCTNSNFQQIYEKEEEYDGQDEFYQMKRIPKNKINQQDKSIRAKIDPSEIKKYFENYYVDNNEKQSDKDSEDSQRTDQDAYDYPDEESSNEEFEEEEVFQSEESFQSYRGMQRKDIQESDNEIEIDEEQQQPFNQNAIFMNFIRQHEKMQQEKKDWKSFNYDNDF